MLPLFSRTSQRSFRSNSIFRWAPLACARARSVPPPTFSIVSLAHCMPLQAAIPYATRVSYHSPCPPQRAWPAAPPLHPQGGCSPSNPCFQITMLLATLCSSLHRFNPILPSPALPGPLLLESSVDVTVGSATVITPDGLGAETCPSPPSLPPPSAPPLPPPPSPFMSPPPPSPPCIPDVHRNSLDVRSARNRIAPSGVAHARENHGHAYGVGAQGLMVWPTRARDTSIAHICTPSLHFWRD
jgi:hypothetical protein